MTNNTKPKRRTARYNGFSDGIIYALAALNTCGDAGSTRYMEILKSGGEDEIVRRARETKALSWSGLADTFGLEHDDGR